MKRSHEKQRIEGTHNTINKRFSTFGETARYQEYLRQPRKESKENETATQLSSLNGNIKEIELWKKALIIAFCDSMDKEFLELAEKAEKKKKKQDLNLMSKGTALKRKADEKKSEIYVLEICAFIIEKQKLPER